MNKPIKIFISYTWDSDIHKNWVKNLAERMFREGFDVILDQFSLKLGDSLFYFMERSVMESAKILIIMTPGYKSKVDAREGGAGTEYEMLSNSFMDDIKNRLAKHIPILRHSDIRASTPMALKNRVFLDMSDDTKFEEKFAELIQHLKDKRYQPKRFQRSDLQSLILPFKGKYRKIDINTGGLKSDELELLMQIVVPLHPYHERLDQLPLIYKQWWERNPQIFRLAFKTADSQAPKLRTLIGFTCIIPLSEDAFIKYKQGLLSEWDIGNLDTDIVAPEGSAECRYLLIQSIELKEQYWKNVTFGTAFTFSLLRHIAAFNRHPFKSKMVLVADGNRVGAQLLELRGFHKIIHEGGAADKRPRYQLDFGDPHLAAAARETVTQIDCYVESLIQAEMQGN